MTTGKTMLAAMTVLVLCLAGVLGCEEDNTQSDIQASDSKTATAPQKEEPASTEPARTKTEEKTETVAFLDEKEVPVAPAKTVEEDGVPVVTLTPVEKSMVIDGRLEAAWAKQPGMELVHLITGGAMDNKTYGAVAVDEKYLYVAAKCYEEDLEDLSFTKTRHDDQMLYEEDTVEIFIDTTKDPQTYYHIMINPTGVYTDMMWNGSDADYSWESDAKVVTVMNKAKGYWIVEVAIPRKSMKTDTDVWRFNLNRMRLGGGAFDDYEDSAWSPTRSDSSRVPSRFGKLKGIK